MDYIKICDWNTFQHYKKRNPPWIKLHTSLLDNERFECLHNDSKVLLMCLWLFVARKGNGEIPADINYLQRKLPIGKKVKLQPLIDAGFIEVYHNDSIVQAPDDSTLLASDRDRGRAEGETKTEIKLSIIFDSARKLYPGTKRGNPTEFSNFFRKHKDWKEIIVLLESAIRKQIEWRQAAKPGDFRPPWKNFQTWINGRCWEDEVKGKEKKVLCSYCKEEPALTRNTFTKNEETRFACRLYGCMQKQDKWAERGEFKNYP